MRALVKKGEGEAEIREIEKPEDQAVVKTLKVGIDGTDREVLENDEEIFPPGSDHMIMGHEAMGRVVEAENMEEGQLVVPTVRRPSDTCPPKFSDRPDFCAPGHYVERGIYQAHGYCSEYFAEKEEYLVPIPEELEDIGVLVEPTSIVVKALDEAFKAQERLDFMPQRALVLGAGSIGLLTCMILRRRGMEVTAVDVVDRDHPKVEILEEIGASYVDNRETDISDLESFDLVLEGSGVTSQIFEAVKKLNPNGAIVSVGLPRDEDSKLEIEAGKFHQELVLENKMILGSVNSSVPHFHEAIDHLQYFQENYPVERILDVHVSLDDWEEAFEPTIKGEIVFDKEAK